MKFEIILDKIAAFLPTLLFSIAIFFIGIIVSKIILKILEKGLEKSKIDKTAHGFIKSLTKIVLYTLVIVIALSSVGVQMASIIAVIGAAGLAVGLALQNSLANLAGGFIILFSKPFKVGDFIETNGVTGTVETITILSTKLLTADNKAVYIPNGQVSGGKVINFTEQECRRLDLSFGISYETDFEKAKSVIAKILLNNNFALSEPPPLVRVSEHCDSCVKIAVQVWVKSENYWNLNYDLMEQVKTEFDLNKIVMPFKQLDVHLDK
ncbi:MAG: mechanosensitive ion channel [Oscillospiraceae bacterium]